MARRRRAKLSLISDDIKPVVRQIGNRQRNVHPEIWTRWIDILGPHLAERAVPQSLRGGRLYIAVSNSAWMQELNFLRQNLIDKFADSVGPDVVKDIRLVLDPTIEIPMPRPEKTKKKPSTNPPPPRDVANMVDGIEDESVREAVGNALRATWNQSLEEK